jgi:hypothetical protein
MHDAGMKREAGRTQEFAFRNYALRFLLYHHESVHSVAATSEGYFE